MEIRKLFDIDPSVFGEYLLEETPTVLIADPSSQELFSQYELEKLIPLTEKAWIDWKGKLPNNYISPLNIERINDTH